MVVQQHTKELLKDLAESLQVSPSRYYAAERSYKAVADWLSREESSLHDVDSKVYIQGSFRLGTAIRPISDEEDYDVDIVCELSLSKTSLTQAQLKALLGQEIQAYARAHQMSEPKEGRRCWTQPYADSSQFHMDILPAVPDAQRKRLLLEHQGLSTKWTETAIAITDREHPNFSQIAEDWPHSNPQGYANWFRSRMQTVFEAHHRALAEEAHISIEDFPEYMVRTPLQSVIQILKNHRDMMFAGRSEDKPISIILTTLAAHAYQQETTIFDALYGVLSRLGTYIEDRNGIAWIVNPTDPAENFADRWEKYPKRKSAFYAWLNQVLSDFITAAQSPTRELAIEALRPRLGKRLIESVTSRRHSLRQSGVLNPKHRQRVPWRYLNQGEVRIQRASYKQNGFDPVAFRSDGYPLPKDCGLIFEACTNVFQPYEVYWQVVNTGRDAKIANNLRGEIEKGHITEGRLIKEESTLFAGTHSIECFIVKQGYLAARSGQFIVNIQ